MTKDADLTRQLIREELEASISYGQKAEATDDPKAKKVYLDISREEKVHAGELSGLLAEQDPGGAEAQQEGMEEAEDIMDEIKKGLPRFDEMMGQTGDERLSMRMLDGFIKSDNRVRAIKRQEKSRKMRDDRYITGRNAVEGKIAEDSKVSNKGASREINYVYFNKNDPFDPFNGTLIPKGSNLGKNAVPAASIKKNPDGSWQEVLTNKQETQIERDANKKDKTPVNKKGNRRRIPGGATGTDTKKVLEATGVSSDVGVNAQTDIDENRLVRPKGKTGAKKRGPPVSGLQGMSINDAISTSNYDEQTQRQYGL